MYENKAQKHREKITADRIFELDNEMDTEDFDSILRNKKIFCFGYNIFICGT